jgi:hypothetical protein
MMKSVQNYLTDGDTQCNLSISTRQTTKRSPDDPPDREEIQHSQGSRRRGRSPLHQVPRSPVRDSVDHHPSHPPLHHHRNPRGLLNGGPSVAIVPRSLDGWLQGLWLCIYQHGSRSGSQSRVRLRRSLFCGFTVYDQSQCERLGDCSRLAILSRCTKSLIGRGFSPTRFTSGDPETSTFRNPSEWWLVPFRFGSGQTFRSGYLSHDPQAHGPKPNFA